MAELSDQEEIVWKLTADVRSLRTENAELAEEILKLRRALMAVCRMNGGTIEVPDQMIASIEPWSWLTMRDDTMRLATVLEVRPD